jgi:carbon monoxide dehydrogenase subunit G
VRLDNSFTVPVALDAAWDMLLDVEQLAPCMPGATIDSIDGDTVKGQVKVKIGPIAMTYQGTLKFVERDRTAHRVILNATASEVRGNGTATATVTAKLTDLVDSTTVSVATDLQITGKAAQFGRGVLAEISGRIIAQFAENLAASLRAGPSHAADAVDVDVSAADNTATRPADAPRPTRPAPAPEALDLMAAVAAPLLKRVLPVLAAGVGLVALTWLARRATGRR